MIRILIPVIIVAFVLAIILYGVGTRAPEEYSGSLTEHFLDRKEDVWQYLTNMAVVAKRKKDVDYIEITADNNSLLTWTEYLDSGKSRSFRMIEKSTPNYLVLERFEDDNGLTGIWTYNLIESSGGTDLTVQEESIDKHVWYRGLKSILGREYNLKKEMKSLRVSLFQRLLTTP